MLIGYDASSIRGRLSGVGYYAASLLEALSAQYPQRRFLVLSHLTHPGRHASNVIPAQTRSFPIKEIWMQFCLPGIIARYRPEICHFTNTVAPVGLRTPYVVTVHDLSLIRHPEWHPRSRRIWMRRILRLSIRRASGILCDSEATRKDLADWLHPAELNARVVPLAARRSFFATCSEKEKEAVRKRYGLDRPFLLFVGNIEPRKNLPRLLAAYRRLRPPEVDLVLAGKRAWLWKETLRQVQSSEFHGRVHLVDYVKEADLPALYQSAEAFVYPSLMEGFGLPVLEAMASGLPVLVSRVEPLVSLVGDAGLLVRPDSVGEWADALTEVIRDKEKGKALAARGKERAGLYSWEAAARETMRCYEEATRSTNDE